MAPPKPQAVKQQELAAAKLPSEDEDDSDFHLDADDVDDGGSDSSDSERESRAPASKRTKLDPNEGTTPA